LRIAARRAVDMPEVLQDPLPRQGVVQTLGAVETVLQPTKPVVGRETQEEEIGCDTSEKLAERSSFVDRFCMSGAPALAFLDLRPVLVQQLKGRGKRRRIRPAALGAGEIFPIAQELQARAGMAEEGFLFDRDGHGAERGAKVVAWARRRAWI